MYVGVEHSMRIVCCDCEPLSLTLVRAQLWPESPSYPRYAFSFKLLDWAEALLLECQVSLKDFCRALYFRCPFPTMKVGLVLSFARLSTELTHTETFGTQKRDIYSCLIDSFEEYRY